MNGVTTMKHNTIKEARFERIYRTYQNDVYKISLYYTRDEHTAQDIAQKVFSQFYLHMDNVNTDSVRAYLIRSARNLAYNWLRDTKKLTKGECLDVIPEDDVPRYSTEEDYLRDEHEQEISKFVSVIMERLKETNESWYEIVNLIYCLEKPHDLVAEELGMSKEVLYNKLYRAKKWIRKEFEKEYKKIIC